MYKYAQEGAKEYQKVIMLFNMSGCGLSNIVSDTQYFIYF